MQKDDVIYRQAAIDAICAVCGNDCDKSEFVYNAPQDEQVILCPEHYCLCTLPSAQPGLPFEIQDILDYLDTVLHPIISPDHWSVYAELHDMISTLSSAQPERKTGRMSNKDWIDFLCEQFDISRTSARDMLHGMMNYKKEDNFKRLFNPMQRDGEG